MKGRYQNETQHKADNATDDRVGDVLFCIWISREERSPCKRNPDHRKQGENDSRKL